nr:sulfotransferase 16 [Tanacetum cinerariifolium]
MDSLSPQVVSAAKLPILNPNEFDLWIIRIEQYFLMTDYSLWEVILNGDSLVPTRIVEGVLQLVAPITAEQRLAQKNELKANVMSSMAISPQPRPTYQNVTNPNVTNLNIINNVNDSLYIASSDHPGMVLTNIHFNGSNFHGWSRNVKMDLGAKLKLGFIDGSFTKTELMMYMYKDG